MKLVSESLANFQRGQDPMTAIGIGIKAAIRRIKEEIDWKIEDCRWKGPGRLSFHTWKLKDIYKEGSDLERTAVKKILEEFLSGKKKWRENQGGAVMSELLAKTDLLWDAQYMWPNSNNVDSVRYIDPKKFDTFISKYWKPNQIYGAGVKHEIADLMKKGILAGATNLEIGGSQPFITAAEWGDLELMKLLLEKSPNDPAGMTKDEKRYNTGSKDFSNAPIRIAAKKGYIDIVKLLMKDPRVDPSAGNNFALNWSFHEGHKEMAILLLTDKRVRDKIDLMPKTRQRDLRAAGLIESVNFQRGMDPLDSLNIGMNEETISALVDKLIGTVDKEIVEDYIEELAERKGGAFEIYLDYSDKERLYHTVKIVGEKNIKCKGFEFEDAPDNVLNNYDDSDIWDYLFKRKIQPLLDKGWSLWRQEENGEYTDFVLIKYRPDRKKISEGKNFQRGVDPKKSMSIGKNSEDLKVYRCGECGNITDSHGYVLDGEDPKYLESADIISRMGDSTTIRTFCEECRQYQENMEYQLEEERRREEEEESCRWSQEQDDEKSYYGY
jgi:hypothetical protein